MVLLDRFNGGNDPEGWILRAEQYFLYLGFSEKDWLPLPSLYLDGEALTWFNWLFLNKQFYDWKHFTKKLLMRFPQRTVIDSARMAANSRAYVDYERYTTPMSAQRSEGVSPSSFCSLPNLQTLEIDEPKDRLIDGHKYLTAVDKIFTANSSKSKEILNAPKVYYVSTDGNSDAAHMFDKMPNGVLEDISSVTPVSPHIDWKNSEGIVDVMVNEETFPNNDSELQSHYETLQAKVPVATFDNTIGISSHFIPIRSTSLVVSSVYNLRVNLLLHSTHEDDVNTGDNVAQMVDFSPLRDPTDFASQWYFTLNVFWRLVKIEFSFDDALWIHIFSYLHILIDEFYLGNRNKASLYLDFDLHKCNWVDTGQECILPRFLLSYFSSYKTCTILDFSVGDVSWLGQIMRSKIGFLRALLQSKSVMQGGETDGGELIGKELTKSLQEEKIFVALYSDHSFWENEVVIPPVGRFTSQYILSRFPYVPATNFLTVAILETAVNSCVWDLGRQWSNFGMLKNDASGNDSC